MDFDDWIDALDAEAERQGRIALTSWTGVACWHRYFRDGMTPAQALDVHVTQQSR